MHYDFAQINHIDQALKAIEGRNEFIVVDQKWFTTIRYAVVTNDTFREVNNEIEAIIHDLRGVAFDKNGKILSRPFHKFFNLNEKSFTQTSLIDFSKEHKIITKLDGSMVRPIFSEEFNGFRLATKAGISDVALQAEVFVASNPHIFKLFRYCLEHGLTPIFEYVAPDNRIVVRYEKTDMVLLAIRETVSGKYFPVEETHEIAKRFNVTSVLDVEEFSLGSIDSFVDNIRSRDDIEGVVIRFIDGHMIKVKTDTYVALHGFVDATANDRRIFALISDGAIDDIKAKADTYVLDKISRAEEKYSKMYSALKKLVQEKIDPHLNRDNKELGLDTSVDPVVKKLTFEAKKGKTSGEIASNLISKNVGRDINFSRFVEKFGLEKTLE